MEIADRWFERAGWEPFEFQRETWSRYAAGESGLIHSATGTGKTLAAWFGPLSEIHGPGLHTLWITPLRALAGDTADSLLRPIRDLGLEVSVGLRTGDTSQSERSKQSKSPPHCLVTTPESLTLMLSRPDVRDYLDELRCVVVDEWHELMGSKRGVQTELALARLRAMRPELRTWGISATLGNLEEALESLLGSGNRGALIRGVHDKKVVIDSVLPDSMRRFPWAGHFGTQMIPHVVEAIEESASCLVFTNTRAMAEIWFQQILSLKPEWTGQVGLHHGSLDRQVREEVELGLKEGRLRAVVCTSSLDLGVDFSPVDRVIQVGSPKGVARLLQRAGRSGHQPGAISRITCVPTHAFELVDVSSARKAAMAGKIESRRPIQKPLDVLAQHLVTVAAGEGFESESLLQEVRSTYSYRELSDEEWQWTLDFVVRGGNSLRAYPEFRRVEHGEEGRYRVMDPEITQRHRMSIGTITSDAAMAVRYVKGSYLGTVEESFLSRLNPGDRFMFAGKPLEFVRIKDMTTWVRPASSMKGAVPRWAGGRLPLSTELSHAIRQSLENAKYGELDTPEMQAVAPILELQMKWSAIPALDEFLIESVEDGEGHHLFFYPFEGRLVHEGMAALFAYRMSRLAPITFTVACNDYGFELLAAERPPLTEALRCGLLETENLAQDIFDALNAAEMAKRQFREIARVAGLVYQGYPGMSKSAKQLQASSGLFFDVFSRYDPQNMLLVQANREVLDRQFEESRLAQSLRRLQDCKLLIAEPERPTPMSFPILVDRLRETVTSESLSDRIDRIVSELESMAG